ncbi:MAG TPA: apolipoprotein N-acyltransferase [Jatrophihabitans sp.]|jgi:apolipoprotein N-acyltransferase|uniref:apolipoprotein N-acyltransferase n=1 Tax=Jatrophihabitans sp. TaxID=1932789 RepID=UPI002DFD099C|nr:apolipoprotein N-acyltransferase [Jatrophihabitans sp.]
MRPVRAPSFATRWAALVAVVGGVLGVVAFPRFGWWPAAFASVAALSVAVDGRRVRTAAWLGYLYGCAFLLPLVQWTGIYVGPVPWLLLGFAFAAFFALLGAVLPLLARLPGGPLWVGAAWVLQEFLRDRIPFGGFPWGRLAFSQAESPLRWFAALGGAPLVTFVVSVAGGGLAVAVREVRARRLRSGALGVAVLVAVPVVGAVLAWPLGPAPDRAGRSETIAVIQGGLPDRGLEFEDRARQVLDNHVRQTLLLAERVRRGTVARPDLVLWPENASDVDPFQDTAAYQEIDAAVKAVGAPVLVGAILQGPGPTHRRNVGILWSPTTGPGAQYVKRHPVPFAEYIPLRSIAEAVSSDAKNVTQDMVAGTGNGLLRGGPVPVGDVICFEVAYDDLVRSSVAAGAQLVVVQTNNATFGHTAETYQQLAMSQLRAVELGRTVVQVATTGKSAVIGPDGRIRDSSGALFTAAVLVDRVPVRSVRTPATRVGAVPEYVLSLVALAGLVPVAALRRRERRPAVDLATPPTDGAQKEMVIT